MNWEKAFELKNLPDAILHIDADSFFVSCEQALNPHYKNKPAITGSERGIASAMSIEAKKMGITRGMPVFKARKICPNLICIPSDYETYSLFSRKMFNIIKQFTPDIEEYSIDEAFADISGMRRTLRMDYSSIAKTIKEEIYKQLNISVSVGLSSTKSLAKLASKYRKPNGFTCVLNKHIPLFLKQINVDEIWGVGINTQKYMQKFNIKTAHDFIEKDYFFVKKHFTKPHQEIWRELRGEKMFDINTEEKKNYDSISKTRTFTPPSKDLNFIFSQLTKNLENACIKARRYNLVTQKISFFLKTQDFHCIRSDFSLNRASAYPSEIAPLLRDLFCQIFDKNHQYRATGIILNNLQENTCLQTNLFEDPLKIAFAESLYKSIDVLNKKFGKHSVMLGSSACAHKSDQHRGSRGELALRKLDLLKGENRRKRIGVPMLNLQT